MLFSAGVGITAPRHGDDPAMTSTFAYLDPGSGSFILQLMLGAVVALAATAKLYWRRILR
jgi:hypothetical protein